MNLLMEQFYLIACSLGDTLGLLKGLIDFATSGQLVGEGDQHAGNTQLKEKHAENDDPAHGRTPAGNEMADTVVILGAPVNRSWPEKTIVTRKMDKPG